MEYLYSIVKEPIGSLLGLLISSIGAFAGFLPLLVNHRNKKQLSYDIHASPLRARSTGASDKAILSQASGPLKDVRAVEILIANSGKVAIPSSDYEENICFTFHQEAEVLAANIAEVYPTNLKVAVDTTAQSVTIKSLLLNPHDSFVLRLLVNNYSPPTIEGRIVDVEKITRGIPGQWCVKEINQVGFTLVFIGTMLLLVGHQTSQPSMGLSEQNAAMIVVGGYTLLLVSIVASKKIRGWLKSKLFYHSKAVN